MVFKLEKRKITNINEESIELDRIEARMGRSQGSETWSGKNGAVSNTAAAESFSLIHTLFPFSTQSLTFPRRFLFLVPSWSSFQLLIFKFSFTFPRFSPYFRLRGVSRLSSLTDPIPFSLFFKYPDSLQPFKPGVRRCSNPHVF